MLTFLLTPTITTGVVVIEILLNTLSMVSKGDESSDMSCGIFGVAITLLEWLYIEGFEDEILGCVELIF